MKILGLELKHPSLPELGLAATSIGIFSALVVLGHYAGVVDSKHVSALVLGGAVGVLGSTFGVSIQRYGWMALILLGAIGLLTHVALTLVGVF